MNVLDGLDEHQLEAVRTLRGPVAVMAGAGSGKTRVITRRIAHGVDVGAFSPGRVMALTFTSKAAGELRGRLRTLGIEGVSARTFHSAALAQLNYFWPTLTGDALPAIVDNKVRLLAHAADTLRLDPDRATLREVASHIEWRKVRMRTIDQYAREHAGGAVGPLSTAVVVELQRAYEQLKDERRQLDFEDVLLACAGMLESEDRVAAAVHEQYRHFTVDEYQDVSPLQQRLLELWVGDRQDLCVVGDASQTIYSFAGADARFLLEFGHRHPDARVVELPHNYRSSPGILSAANQLMRGRPGSVELVAGDVHRGVGDDLLPMVAEHRDEIAEARAVAASVAERIAAGADPRAIAVLYRAHGQSAELIEALADAGVPTTVLGGTRFFDIPEVRQAIMALRGASVAPLENGFVDTVRDVLRSLGLTDQPPPAGGAVRDAWEARAALLRLAEEAPEGTTLREFTDDVMARARAQDEPALRTVTLATLHAAKGLEWDHVYLTGMAEGLLPIGYATGFEAIDEERRLTYVGITRARRTLSLSWSRGSRGREPSRFLQEIRTCTRDAVPRSAPRGGAWTRRGGD
ncbi:ATP-dependent DNA helicase UvrD2 [Microbacterium sediminicola]|uniref:DNA 3'-5' helicase n=1 Tax=Microbacterium sediminicola TaxID=415210 RepID=A0ABN2HMZ2_9MICO